MNKYQAPNTPTIYRRFQSAFGGLNHTTACGDGELYDMRGIESDEYPVLRTADAWQKDTQWDNTGRTYLDDQSGSHTDVVPAVTRIWEFDGLRLELEVPCKDDGAGHIIPDTSGVLCFHATFPDGMPTDVDFLKNNNANVMNNAHLKYGSSTDYEWTKQDNDKLTLVCMGKYVVSSAGGVLRTDCRGWFSTLTAANSSITDPVDGDVIAINYPVLTNNNLNNTKGLFTEWIYYVWKNGEGWVQTGQRTNSNRAANYTGVSFTDGTLYGVSAEENTMVRSGGWNSTALQLKPGDTICVRGSTLGNNGHYTIREVSADGTELRFNEHVFANGTEGGTITVEMTPPELDFIATENNRIFGCKNDTIWASALGDPYNWYTYDGLATDAWSVDVGSTGDFTGCAAYGGDVYFFKENCFYRLYNTEQGPDKWVLVKLDYPGVLAGSARSLAVADGSLYYLSPKGMMRFSGSVPANIQTPLGKPLPLEGIGGSDMEHYYCCLRTVEDNNQTYWRHYKFDTRVGAWYRHGMTTVTDYCYSGLKMYCVRPSQAGAVWRMGNDQGYPFQGMLETGDYQMNTVDRNSAYAADRKKAQKLQICLENLDIGAFDGKVTVEIGWHNGRQNSTIEWMELAKIPPGFKRIEEIVFPPIRNDFYRIRLTLNGQCRIWNMTLGRLSGSEHS